MGETRSAKRVINGTWGEVWLDGDYVAECYGLQLKTTFTKEAVPMCGQMTEDQKITSIAQKGTLKLHKVNSRMAILYGEKVRKGLDPRFTIISKLADPDAYGNERVVATGVSFDDLTLADWEAKTLGKIECPFTFSDYQFLDRIEV